jgi:hypothetical protein
MRTPAKAWRGICKQDTLKSTARGSHNKQIKNKKRIYAGFDSVDYLFFLNIFFRPLKLDDKVLSSASCDFSPA